MKKHTATHLWATALVLSACAQVSPAVPAVDLTGNWTAALGSSITLELTLRKLDSFEAAALGGTNMQIDHPTYMGEYLLTAPFALDTTISGAHRPSVLVGQSATDSILIAAEPYVDHGSLVLSGIRSGNTITGSWTVTGYVILDRGTFVMRRASGRP